MEIILDGLVSRDFTENRIGERLTNSMMCEQFAVYVYDVVLPVIRERRTSGALEGTFAG